MPLEPNPRAESAADLNLLVRRPNWKPALLIQVSLVVLLSSIALTLWHPALWPWTASLVGANHALLVIAGLWPRSQVLGSNWIRLPAAAARRGEVAITIDDGPDPEVTPQVLDILDRYQVQATFFCIGICAERHADLCRDIVRRGHALENHSQHHSVLFSLFGPLRTRREILLAQETLTQITGQTPRFFRPTAGLRSPLLHPILAHLGLQLVSWSRRAFDTREADPDIVLARLTRNLRAGDILLLHDGNAARTRAGIPVIVDVLPRLLDRLRQANLSPVTLRSTLP